MKPTIDSDTAIRGKLKPGRHRIAKSLYLNVTPQQGKSWVLRVVANGKRRELGLGSYPDLPLAKARDEAARYRLTARRGGDPAAERDKERVNPLTFEQAAREAYAQHKSSWRNEKHRAQWINTLETYAFPLVGSNPVSTIESPDVLKVLAPIWLTKPETARRVRQRMALVMDWARAHGHRVGENPCSATRTGAGLPKQPTKPDDERHFAAMPYADVPTFAEALHATPAPASQSVLLALEFLILTAARTGEVIGAKWSEIDLEKKVWTIPAGRMKAERKHRVPLSSRAVEILNAAEKLPKRSGYVFPGTDTDHLSNMAFLMLLRRMDHDCTAHGFRSAFRTWAEEKTNFPRQVCEWALAHGINDKTEASYNRTDQIEKRRKLMTAWETYVSGGAKVVQLATRKAAS